MPHAIQPDHIHLPTIPHQVSGRLAPHDVLSERTESAGADWQGIEPGEDLEKLVATMKIELENVRGELHRSNSEFQQFANAVSHDLQAPLRATSGFSNFLQQEYGGQLDDTANVYIAQIVDASHRMAQLIQGLVAFSRISTRAAPFTAVDLNEVSAAVVESLGDSIDNGRAVVICHPLPNVRGDRAQLFLLLRNILENSLKFNVSETPEVQIGATQNGTNWTIAVADNGIGIAPQHRESVFEIFRRLNSHQEYSGHGTGLAICRRIVQRHSGKIWCTDNDAAGTTMCFSIGQDSVNSRQSPSAIELNH